MVSALDGTTLQNGLKEKKIDKSGFAYDNIKMTSANIMSMENILEYDEQVASPLTDEANQSSSKKVFVYYNVS